MQGMSRQQLEAHCSPIQTQEKISCIADVPTCKLSPHEARGIQNTFSFKQCYLLKE